MGEEADMRLRCAFLFELLQPQLKTFDYKLASGNAKVDPHLAGALPKVPRKGYRACGLFRFGIFVC